MMLQITLGPDKEARLRAGVAAAGVDVGTFAREALMEKVDRTSLAELLAPIHEATRRSGMNEDEIDSMIEQARDDVWRERQNQGRQRP